MFRLFAHIRLFALVALVAALGVRGAVPAGYMLDRSGEDASIVIRLCGTGEGHQLVFDPEKRELRTVGSEDGSSDSDDLTEDGTCPYAVTAAFDLPHTPPAVAPPLGFGMPLLRARPYARPMADDPVHAPLPARGPPVHV